MKEYKFCKDCKYCDGAEFYCLHPKNMKKYKNDSPCSSYLVHGREKDEPTGEIKTYPEWMCSTQRTMLFWGCGEKAKWFESKIL